MRSNNMLAVTVENGPEAVEVDIPEAGPEEILVRVERVGICGTDLAMFDNYTDFKGIIGHEFSGVVEGGSSKINQGLRVTSSINFLYDDMYGWGDFWSKPDEAHLKHKADRKALGIRGWNGAMAEYVVIPQNYLLPLSDEISFAAGAMLEPLAAAMHAVSCIPEGDSDVLVVGDGKLAQLISRVLLLKDRRVRAMGINALKMNRMREEGVIIEEDPGRQFSVVVEVTGSEEGINAALSRTAPLGTLILKSTLSHKVNIDLSKVVVDEINLIGSRCGNLYEARELLENSSLEVEDLITAVYPLRDAKKAFIHACHPDALKIQMSPFGN